MKTFRSNNLQGSILAAFSILLFLSFVLVGGAFNLAIDIYIRTSAISVLDEARTGHYNLIDEPLLDRLFGTTRNYLLQGTRFFIIDENYRPLNPSASAHDIAVLIRQDGLRLADIRNQRLRTTDQRTYFISSATAPGERYTIFYVDVTHLQRFTRIINTLLITLAGFIWLVAIIIAGFLAGSLARPLYILRDFAQRIGQGDFTPNPISFSGIEFEALNQSLNLTAKQLDKYDNDQKTFFQNASHELRTPLMTIKSYAEGIKYGIMESDKASQTILDATERLSGMVNDVLYISRIDSITTPSMESTDLRLLIQEHINRHIPLADSKGLTIKFTHTNRAIIINCASSYIGRVLDNLISNAMRYAAANIMVDCAETDSHVTIQVTDDGPGFEPDVLPHVFERFYKGKNGLTGIGLSVVRSIVEQHKGTAMAENIESGARLTISLPK